MASAKVATVIENKTGRGLTMKVRNPHCFVRMASVKRSEHFTLRLRTDWTYQEFVLEDKTDAGKKLFVDSDDCCDYERIAVKESDGIFHLETVARKQIGGSEEDAAAAGDQRSEVAMKKEKLRWRSWLRRKLHVRTKL